MEIPSFQDLERQKRNNFKTRSSFSLVKKLGPPISKDLNFVTPSNVVFSPTPTPSLTPTPTPFDRCRAINSNFHEYNYNDCEGDSTKVYVTTSFPALPGVICYGCVDKTSSPNLTSFDFYWNAGCIYPPRNCAWPYNFLVSTTVSNPYSFPVQLQLTGSVDDDLWIQCDSFKRWARSGNTNSPYTSAANGSCTAGGFSVTFNVSANETILLEAYDIYGSCGSVNLHGEFHLI